MSLKSYSDKFEKIVLDAMGKPAAPYWIALTVSFIAFVIGMSLWVNQMINGMGMAHINNPVGWGVYITDFVFWVGIAHSGTLISAVLFLFRAKFRNSFNRSAEAMTVIAVMTAGLFPLIHIGRSWLFYWLLPFPNQRLLWVNFKSPLMWDVFAVSTYFTVSVIFFYVGLIPDLAVVRRYASGVKKWVYSALSLGWIGTPRQWKHYNMLYLFLAAFATPLVISVHSVVSWDFAMSVIPGWHTTIFAPYFVAGAIYSGTAMVITLMVPMRKILHLENYIPIDHFEKLAKLMLFTSMIVGYSYIVEFAMAFYSGNQFETAIFSYRVFGHYKVEYAIMFLCNVVFPLLVFVKKFRTNLAALWILSLFVNVGMWLERFIIVVTSLAKDYDPYNWGLYSPGLTEIGITVGSFGMFFMFFLIFVKVLPVVSITEIKENAE